MHVLDQSSAGFQWVEADDVQRSAYAFLRWGEGSRPILVLANFTPVTWEDYLVGVPKAGVWRLLCSSDAPEFGGEGLFGVDQIASIQAPNQGFEQSLRLRLPPLSVSFLAPDTFGEVSG
jgi:1,4-alpha-glucan branching enzyme